MENWNQVNWFEIATNDLERAKKFYSDVFGSEFQYMEMQESKMYMFTGAPDKLGATGTLIKSDMYKPTSDGTIVYFYCEDLANELSKVEGAGGKTIFPKTSIGEHGFIAQFTDTEGNRLGLHSQK